MAELNLSANSFLGVDSGIGDCILAQNYKKRQIKMKNV